jgi:hypothetical protein
LSPGTQALFEWAPHSIQRSLNRWISFGIGHEGFNADRGHLIQLGDFMNRNNVRSDHKTIDDLQKCELCEQKMNPTVKIYNKDTHLCKVCFHHMERLPDIVAKSVERFLIGNVV